MAVVFNTDIGVRWHTAGFKVGVGVDEIPGVGGCIDLDIHGRVMW